MPGIHHTAIVTADAERSIRFWCDGLVFVELFDHTFTGDWPTADMLLDAHRLPTAIIDEVYLREAEQDGTPIAPLELRDDAGAYDLLGRNAVARLGEGAHELDAAA